MLQAYRSAAAEREAMGIPALPLTAKQTEELVELLKSPPAGEGEFLVDLITNRVPPGVDDASKVKASFLAAVAEGSVKSPLISPEKATELLGTMLGGYNIHPLIELLDNDKLAAIAALALSGKATPRMLDSINITPNQWPTHAVIDLVMLLQRMKDAPQRDERLAQAQQILRSRLTFNGTRVGFSTDQDDGWWWLDFDDRRKHKYRLGGL